MSEHENRANQEDIFTEQNITHLKINLTSVFKTIHFHIILKFIIRIYSKGKTPYECLQLFEFTGTLRTEYKTHFWQEFFCIQSDSFQYIIVFYWLLSFDLLLAWFSRINWVQSGTIRYKIKTFFNCVFKKIHFWYILNAIEQFKAPWLLWRATFLNNNLWSLITHRCKW